MQVWIVLHVARCKYVTQKLHKKSPSVHHRTTCWAISSQVRHVSTVGKELVTQQYLLHMSLQYGELQPTNSWDPLVSFGHPSKFKWVLCLGFVTAATSLTGGQPNFARCSTISCAATLYIYTFGGSSPRRKFARCKMHFVSKSFFSYIGSVTARH